jgi:non-homologous end joining protein Ku
MKAICKGTLTFNLVKIDIELNLVNSSIGYRFVHKTCLKPINLLTHKCVQCDHRAEITEIVKGIKLIKNKKYLEIEQLETAINIQNIENLSDIEIIDFVQIEVESLDNNYYYAFPTNILNDIYFLLFDFLQKHNRVAIGNFTLDNMNCYVGIYPMADGLVFNVFNDYCAYIKDYFFQFSNIGEV